MTTEMQTRRFSLDVEETRRKPPDATRYSASLSSEEPVERDFGYEVLLHTPEAVDLTRARDGLPILLFHDHTRPAGVAENVRLVGRRLVADLRFFTTADGQEAQRMVEEGLKTLSIGYVVNKKRESGKRGGIPVYTVDAWQLLEVSLLPVAADATVGVGRASQVQIIHERKHKMETQQAEGDRVRAIVDLGEQFRKFLREGDVREALNSGRSVEQFKEQILVRMESKAADVSTRSVGMTQAEAGRYSLARALQASVTGDWTRAGLEREASRALERVSGMTAEGFLVPAEIWAKRDFNAGTASEAGNLIASDMRTDMYVDALRANMVLGQLGVRVISGLSANCDIPRKSVAGTLGMLSEIGSASETQPTTAKVTLSPKRLAAYVEVSKQALIQSALPLEAMLRDDLLMGAASLIEAQAFNGVGSNNEFLGLRNVANIGTVIGGANGAALSWEHILGLETAVAIANSQPGARAGYVLNAKTLAKGKQVTKSTYMGWLIDDGVPDGAGFVRSNGHRVAVTNHLPSNLTKGTSTTICSAALFSSDWSMAVLGLFGAPDVVVDPYSLAATGQVKITLNQFADMVVRQPAAFAKIEDLLTA